MRFSSLVAMGEEIPFDVAEGSGEQAFYRYEPLTARFVHDHEHELHSLPSFEPARTAVISAGVAAAYLEAQGQAVPEDPEERAGSMLVAFVARLWEGSGEFTLDKARLEAALHELEAEARPVSEAKQLIAPLVGLQMPLARLELPSGVRIVRADTVETPAEAMRSEGMHRSAWEPQFVALADQDDGPEGSASAIRMLRDLISVMRLFKEGGIGLGPYVFAPTGEDRWRRIATGVPETRPCAYKLSEAEATELADFACRLEAQPDPCGALAWAVARFEMGCERRTALEGLSDHLLALRAIFEQEGPIGAALPMRVAALISEPAEREEAREKVQGTFELERALMAGRALDTGRALGVAAWLEDGARAILREAALGMHGEEIGTAADEALIAAGLDAGEGSADQMGGTSEWDAIVVDETATVQDHPIHDHPPATEGEEDLAHRSSSAPWRDASQDLVIRASSGASTRAEFDARAEFDVRAASEGTIRASRGGSTRVEHDDDEPATEVDIEVPDADRIQIRAGGEITVVEEDELEEDWAEPEDELEHEEPPDHDQAEDEHKEIPVTQSSERDWLAEVSRGRRDDTLEWPARRAMRDSDERVDSPRVRHLFPVPEGTDWEVGELRYDRDSARVG
ncbi:MAG: hypothetical protein AABM29_04175 [Actinomycetota bacterium]